MNSFTLFALKSKRIELQCSAWRHLIAFLKSFLTVTGFPRVFFTIWMKYDKNYRTLVLNKIVFVFLHLLLMLHLFLTWVVGYVLIHKSPSYIAFSGNSKMRYPFTKSEDFEDFLNPIRKLF